MPITQVTLPSTSLPEELVEYFHTLTGTKEPFTLTIKQKENGTFTYILAPYGEENMRVQTPIMALNEGTFGSVYRGALPADVGNLILATAHDAARQWERFLSEVNTLAMLGERVKKLEQRVDQHGFELEAVQGLVEAYGNLLAEHAGKAAQWYEQLSHRIDALEGMVATLREVATPAQGMEEVYAKADAALTLAQRVSDEVRSIAEQLPVLRDAVATLSVKADTAFTSAQFAQADLALFKADVEVWQEHVQERFTALEGAVQAVKANLYPRMAVLSSDLREVEQAMHTLRQAYAGLEQRVTEQGKQLSQLEETVGGQKSQLEELVQRMRENETRIQLLQRENATLRAEVRKLEDTLHTTQTATGIVGSLGLVLLGVMAYALWKKK